MTNQMSPKKWVYLPCEIEHREIYHRTLLAVALAHKGYASVVGAKIDIIKHCERQHLPPGLFTHKDAGYASLPFIKHILTLGFEYAVIDEEALAVFKGGAEHIESRVIEEFMEHAKLFFSSCEQEYDILQTKPYADKVKLTGTTKFDVYRENYRDVYLKKAEEYQAKYGDFIFIPSNFAIGDQTFEADLKILLKGYEGTDSYQAMYDYYHIIQKNRLDSADAFKTMVRKLAGEFPDKQIVFRPHQADDQRIWIEAFGDVENVHIILEGIVAPWLLACKIMIHNGCTTAVEGSLMGLNTLAYVPVIDEGLLLDEPTFKVSEIIKDEAELIESIKARYANDVPLPKDKKDYIEDLLFLEKTRTDQDFKANFDIMVHEVETIELKKQPFDLKKWKSFIAWLTMKEHLYDLKMKMLGKHKVEAFYKTKIQNQNFEYAKEIVEFYSHCIDPSVKLCFTKLDQRVFLVHAEDK